MWTLITIARSTFRFTPMIILLGYFSTDKLYTSNDQIEC